MKKLNINLSFLILPLTVLLCLFLNIQPVQARKSIADKAILDPVDVDYLEDRNSNESFDSDEMNAAKVPATSEYGCWIDNTGQHCLTVLTCKDITIDLKVYSGSEYVGTISCSYDCNENQQPSNNSCDCELKDGQDPLCAP